MPKRGTFLGEVALGLRRLINGAWYWQVLILTFVLGYLSLAAPHRAPAFFLLWVALSMFAIIRAAARSAAQKANADYVAAGYREPRNAPAPAAPRPPANQAQLDLHAYCEYCGEIFPPAPASCPNCGHSVRAIPRTQRMEFFARFLGELTAAFRQGYIDRPAFERLRAVYEQHLIAARPHREPAPAPAPAPAPEPPRAVVPQPELPPPAPPPARHVPPPPAPPAREGLLFPRPEPARAPEPVHATAYIPPTPRPARARPEVPPRPPVDIRKALLGWTAKRQADLLLYLGAFLLTISAIIFVNYKGDVVGGEAKAAIFAVYTLMFLGLGLGIRRWERVKEASPVFVGLGAIMTPLNFVMLWTEVLGDREVSQPVVWLAGSTTTAALYAFLAWRGFGRFYLIPATVAAVLAWGSLAATLHIGEEWFGAWYGATAAVASALGTYRIKTRRHPVELAGAVLGVPALVWSIGCAISAADNDYSRAQLPVTLAILAIAAFPPSQARRFVPTLVALPALMVGAVATSFWAAEVSNLGEREWVGVWIALVGAAYLLVAWFDEPHRVDWGASAGVVIAAGCMVAQQSAADGHPPALATTYGIAFVSAAASWAAWRWRTAGVAAPPLAAFFAIATLRAASAFSYEWTGFALAFVPLGYILLVELDRPAAVRWRSLAVVAGVIALALTHAFAIPEETTAAAIPATYAVLGAAAALEAWLHRFAPAWLFAPALATGLGMSSLWSLEVDVVWWVFVPLVVAAATLALEPFWRTLRLLGTWNWPYALVLALAPLLFNAAFIETEDASAGFTIGFDPAILGAAAFALAGAIWIAASLRVRGGLLRLVHTLESEPALVIEQRLVAIGGGGLELAALAYANRALGWSPPQAAWIFLVAGVAAWLAVAALGRMIPRLHGILGPLGVAAIVIAGATATTDGGQETLMLAIASSAAALAIQQPFAANWRRLMLLASVLSLGAGHIHALDVGDSAWQLPAAYAFVLANFLWDALIVRNDFAWLGVPATAATGASSLAWYLGVPPEHWAWPALAASAAIEAATPWWRSRPALARFGWPYALVAAAIPLAFTGVYLDHAWIGAGAMAASAIPWLVAAIWSDGAIGKALNAHSANALAVERRLLAWGSMGLAYAAIGHANHALGWSLPESAWPFAAVAIASWLAVALAGRRLAPELHGILGPGGAAGLAIAVLLTLDEPGQQTLIVGAATIAAALALAPARAIPWRTVLVVLAAETLIAGHRTAVAGQTDAWQLPTGYGLVAAAFAWDAIMNRCDRSWLAIPALLATGSTTGLYILDVGVEHWAWPYLAAAGVIEAASPWWLTRRDLRLFGWPYALLTALAPAMLATVYVDQPWIGAAAFAVAALAWLVAALRSKGLLAEVLLSVSPRAASAERRLLAWGAVALGYASAGYVNHALDASFGQAAWTYASAGVLGWLVVALFARRAPEFHGIFGPAAAAGFVIAVALAYEDPGQQALVLGAAAMAASAALQSPFEPHWRTTMLVAGAVALGFGQRAAALDGTDAWQLPSVYAMALAALAWDALVHRFDPSWLGIPGLGAVGVGSLLFVLGVGPEHYAWSGLGWAAAVEASATWWRKREKLAAIGWPYALALAFAPVVFASTLDGHEGPGAGQFLLASLAWAFCAARSRNEVVAFFANRPVDPEAPGERTVLGLVSAGLLFIAAGLFGIATGLERSEAAWLYVVIGTVAWFEITAARSRIRELNLILIVTATAATLVALVAAEDHPGESAIICAIAAAGSAQAILGVRRWFVAGFPAVATTAALAFAWRYTGWPTWSLALAYGAAAAATAVALTPFRDWRRTERGAITSILSVVPWFVAAGSGAIALAQRRADLAPGDWLPATPEWATIAALAGLAGAGLIAEGLRFHRRAVWLPGTVVALGALELAIAILEPSTIQVYTTPAGLYVMAVTLWIRHSPDLFGPHMQEHEALLFGGEALVVVPGARDALASGALGWSFLLIFEGLVLLFGGLALANRWLVVGGVLTIVGVAGRFFTAGAYQPPYWLTLAILGLVLIAGGVVMLGARDWWDRQRERIVAWWFRNELPPGGGPRGMPPAVHA